MSGSVKSGFTLRTLVLSGVGVLEHEVRAQAFVSFRLIVADFALVVPLLLPVPSSRVGVQERLGSPHIVAFRARKRAQPGAQFNSKIAALVLT